MEPKLDLSGITIGGEDDHMGGYEFAASSNDTITLSSLNYGHSYPNISITGPNVYTTSGSLGPFTTTTSPYTFSAGTNTSPWYNQTTSSKIRLDGADADIEVNGVSLLKTMQEIANRLNIMHTNPELETQWSELRELGEQYRKLEQHILDKQATFDRVRAMPAPDVD
jgi:hypothetical protein